MKIIVLALACACSFSSARATEPARVLNKRYADTINSVTKTWKAGVNFQPNTQLKYVLGLLGSRGVRVPSSLPAGKPLDLHGAAVSYRTGIAIPKEFDARKAWKNCTSIGYVPDQGNCGNCWAFSTAGAFSDRLCIATRGQFRDILSTEELTFCCKQCGFGCQGGYPIKAWSRFYTHGLVTGGTYNSKKGCQPYTVPPCSGKNACQIEKNHNCSSTCYGNTTIDFNNDHNYVKYAYYPEYESLQKDLMQNGPLEASFEVYEDFIYYKSGVYVKSPKATYLGDHSVKLIGWGVERNVPYWLMVNSWNESWGDRGLFKIRRGTNECMVDRSTTAGMPKVYNSRK